MHDLMTLPSLQYDDISRAVTSAIAREAGPYCIVEPASTHIDRMAHVVMHQQGPTRHRHRDGSHGSLKSRPLLEARPLFPNSLLSSEVGIRFPALRSSRRQDSPIETEYRGLLDQAPHNPLNYRLQAPLPAYLGGHLYRAGRHAIVLLDNESGLDDLDSSLIRECHVTLNAQSYRHGTPAQVLIPHFLDGKTGTGGNLRSRRRGTVLMEIYRLAELCHRLNVIGKSDLVLCDSAGIAIDAIRSAVPAAFVRGVPPGHEAIQSCVMEFLQHGDAQRLLQEQRAALKQLLQENAGTMAVTYRRQTLASLLDRVFAATGLPVSSTRSANTSQSSQTTKSREQADTLLDRMDCNKALILQTQQALCSRSDAAIRLKSSLQSSRRKFRKFRESPSRFMEDSQNGLLRTLAGNRITR